MLVYLLVRGTLEPRAAHIRHLNSLQNAWCSPHKGKSRKTWKVLGLSVLSKSPLPEGRLMQTTSPSSSSRDIALDMYVLSSSLLCSCIHITLAILVQTHTQGLRYVVIKRGESETPLTGAVKTPVRNRRREMSFSHKHGSTRHKNINASINNF